MRKTMLLVGAMAMMAASLFGQARQEEKAVQIRILWDSQF